MQRIGYGLDILGLDRRLFAAILRAYTGATTPRVNVPAHGLTGARLLNDMDAFYPSFPAAAHSAHSSFTAAGCGIAA
ncbi:hypothetical protein [Asticcacaulis benevestitus]|uniref:hypothetical protein n=1 Tax=Asticcacaulis benevestitus TaxID=347481 RepID=UPI00039E0BC6|nr:hypothetical protein [Asticcacaulis benevestitus]